MLPFGGGVSLVWLGVFKNPPNMASLWGREEQKTDKPLFLTDCAGRIGNRDTEGCGGWRSVKAEDKE